MFGIWSEGIPCSVYNEYMGWMALGLGFKMFCVDFLEYHDSSAILQFGLMIFLYSNYPGLCFLCSGYANTAVGTDFSSE